MQFVNNVIFSQYGMKQGIKLFFHQGVDAVTKELQQLHDCKVIRPRHPGELTYEQKNKTQ